MSGAAYSVVANNIYGTVTSSNATLKVLPALPRILVWSDEFDGTVINPNNWQRQGDIVRQQGYWMKEDSYLNGQGQLVLRVMQDPANGHYGSGALQGSFLRAFGYFEAKVKFPTQQGHWPAFWLMSNSEGQTNVIGGSAGAEIDIVEKAWLTDHLQQALHWNGYPPSPLAGSDGIQVTNVGVNDGGWHLFAVDWTSTNYAFYVDGTLTWSTNSGGVSQVPEYMMLTEEVGNFGAGPNAWGTGPITNALLPDYFLVEYARVYDTNLLVSPLIVTQPQSASVPAGSTATFTAGVTNNATLPISYTWWKLAPGTLTNAVASNQANAFSDSYTTPPLWAVSSGAEFYVVVTNVFGSTTSAIAAVTIPPARFDQPVFSNAANLLLTWSGGGILESATNPTGPWSVVTNAASPTAIPIEAAAPLRLFRVQQ